MNQALNKIRSILPKIQVWKPSNSHSNHFPHSILGNKVGESYESFYEGEITIDHHQLKSDIHILKSPTEYYHSIRNYIKTSKTEIILSALYFGRGDLELDILNDMNEALHDKNRPLLTITMILDHTRSMRRTDGSVDILSPIIDKHYPRFQVWFYQMPSSKGIFRRFLPSIIKETLGVYHAKFNIFDNSVILTGANLSHEYFVSRQDRYFLLEYDSTLDSTSKSTSTKSNIGENVKIYLKGFSIAIRDYCHHLHPNRIISSPKNRKYKKLKNQLEILFLDPTSNNVTSTNTTTSTTGTFTNVSVERKIQNEVEETTVHPLIQFKDVGINQEKSMILSLLSMITAYTCNISLSSPYPSFKPDLLHALSRLSSKSTITIYKTSNDSHGFANGKGLKSLVPRLHEHYFINAMDYLSNKLLNKSKSTNSNSNSNPKMNSTLRIMSYDRSNWTYHAKGMWIEFLYSFQLDGLGKNIESIKRPHVQITYIGSSNFGSRSWTRDFELGFVIVTSNKQLQRLLGEEVDNLASDLIDSGNSKDTPVSNHSYTLPQYLMERILIPILTRIFKNYL